jgi:hypothetical protein
MDAVSKALLEQRVPRSRCTRLPTCSALRYASQGPGHLGCWCTDAGTLSWVDAGGKPIQGQIGFKYIIDEWPSTIEMCLLLSPVYSRYCLARVLALPYIASNHQLAQYVMQQENLKPSNCVFILMID